MIFWLAHKIQSMSVPAGSRKSAASQLPGWKYYYQDVHGFYIEMIKILLHKMSGIASREG